MDGSFAIKAVIEGPPSIQQHYRDRDHRGAQDDTTVVLDSDVGTYNEGDTLAVVLADLATRSALTGTFDPDPFTPPSPSRNEHYRDRDHTGTELASQVVLDRDLGRYDAGTDILTVLIDLDARLGLV